MKDYRLTVRLPNQLHRRLQDAALRSGNPQSELVRKAVEQQLAAEDRELTAFERAEEAGLIGAVRNAPRDLSTNRKHFAGFGRS